MSPLPGEARSLDRPCFATSWRASHFLSPPCLQRTVSDMYNTLTEWGRRLCLHSVGRPDRFVFGIEDADSVVQACDLEDVPVVLGEAVGEEPLLLAVDADEQRDQEPDAATVHVLEALEVQYDGARLAVTSLVVGVHQNVLGECRELSLDVYDTHLLADLPDVHLYLCLGHAAPPILIDLLYLLVLGAQR